jgi:hypothetical protein
MGASGKNAGSPLWGACAIILVATGSFACPPSAFANVIGKGAIKAEKRESSEDKKEKKPKPHPRLKVGEEVQLSQCQKSPATCVCPTNSRPLSYRRENYVRKLVCINTACPKNQALEIRPNKQGVREGVCVAVKAKAKAKAKAK